MDRMTGSTSSLSGILTETTRERLSLRADMNMNGGLAFSLDETRAAALGRLAELPSLGECLAGWQQRIIDDACRDYPIPFRDLELNADGRLAFSEENGPLPMTYRTFGSLLRRYCAPPRNVARVLFELPVLEKGLHSPRACAYNAYLERHNAPERARLAIVGGEEGPEIIWLRSRLLRQAEVDGVRPPPVRTIIAGLSPTHSLQSGDDDKLITALTIAFAGAGATARATAFRGIDESEMRAVFPALEVQIADAGSEKWMGYVTARNSESGAKSWSISAGLYRTKDGASVACEAILRTGRHVGTKVPERMVEVATGAAELLQKLIAEANELASKAAPWSEESTLKRIREALGGTIAHDPDVCCALAFELGRSTGAMSDPITVGLLMNAIGLIGAAAPRRIDARPLEVLLGRVLVQGWKELKAVATDVEADEEEV